MLVQIQYLSRLRDLPGPEKTEVSGYAEIQASPMRQRLRRLRQKTDQFRKSGVYRTGRRLTLSPRQKELWIQLMRPPWMQNGMTT
jgi:hypothetical protein